MVKFIFPLMAVLGGMAVALQGQINGGLGKKVGVIESSFISFTVGTAALFFCLLFFGNGNISGISTVPKWQLTGGLLGIVYMIVMVIAVPKIGVSATLMAVIMGQIILGAVIDHFGLFGGNRIPLDLPKGIAFLLMLAAIFLYNKK